MEENRNTENEKKKPDKKNDKKFAEFWNAHKNEFKKITWPSREDLIKETLTVIVVSLIVGGIIFAYDKAILFTYEKSMSMIKGSNSATTQTDTDSSTDAAPVEDETAAADAGEASSEVTAAPSEDSAPEVESGESATE